MTQGDLDHYASLMHEIRRRLEVIRSFLAGRITTTYLRTNTESMCLQLRKVLELIAFSSLVSQRTAYELVRQNIGRDWHAERILMAVEKFNPRFYPKPVQGFLPPVGQRAARFNFTRCGFLTRRQFTKLYDSCGGILHASNPFSSERNFVAFSRAIPATVKRIEALLSEHAVCLASSTEHLWVHVPAVLSHPVVVQHIAERHSNEA